MKRVSSLIMASFLLASATAVAAPVSVDAQPQCGDEKKGDDKKDDKSGDTKPKNPSFN